MWATFLAANRVEGNLLDQHLNELENELGI